MSLSSLFTSALIILFFSNVYAKSESLKVSEVFKGSDVIWSIEFFDNNTILFTEKAGKIKKLNLKTKKYVEIKNAPLSYDSGQGGLLDLHLDPEFTKNKRVFISYTKKLSSEMTTAIATGVLKGNTLEHVKDIFVANKPSSKSHHFGSRIVHDEKGFLYFSVGDRGDRDLAQSLSADQGKIHRINLDGSVPLDNPFAKTQGAQKTIWSYGHRNPQGLIYDFKDKKLYEQEHGPRGGDEINLIEKGKNYGWPVITYGREYYGPKIGQEKKAGMEQPLYHYTPSIAPSGLEIYRGGPIKAWEGQLLSGALKLQHLNKLNIKTNPVTETRLLTDQNERIRDVKLSPDKVLYLSTDSGKILKIEGI